MIGHQIYTRANYKFGNDFASGSGTWTAELKQEVLPPKFAIPLESGYSNIDTHLAGGTQEGSLFRLFRPKPNAVMISRTYFVDDVITTGRGTVPFTFSFILTNDDRKNFLFKPNRELFKPGVFETYESFAHRVKLNNDKIIYYPEIDHEFLRVFNREQPSENILTKTNWENLVTNEWVFANFFVHLCKAISNNTKIAVVLPEGTNGADFIFMTLSILPTLPTWFRADFGAISHWYGAISGNDVATTVLKDIQLVCFVGTFPDDNETCPIIDFTRADKTKNLNYISPDERELANFYWHGIDKPSKIEKLEIFIEKTFVNAFYSNLNFKILSLVYRLWRSYGVGDNKTFNMAKITILSLLECFNAEDLTYFFKQDSPILYRVLTSFVNGLNDVRVSEIEYDVVVALCEMAKASVILTYNHNPVEPDDYINPLFDKFYAVGRWEEVAIISDYYTEVLKTDIKESHFIIIGYMIMLLDTKRDLLVDKAYNCLKNIAETLVRKLVEINIDDNINNFDYKYYEIISREISLRDLIPLDIEGVLFAQDFKKYPSTTCKIIEENRHHGRLNPPYDKKLSLIWVAIESLKADEKEEYRKKFMQMFWDSKFLKEPFNIWKYIRNLDKCNQTHMFVVCDVGVDVIRGFYTNQLNDIFERECDRIKETHALWERLNKVVKFKEDDGIFDILDNKLEIYFNNQLQILLTTLHPDDVTKLFRMARPKTKAGLNYGVLEHMRSFDESIIKTKTFHKTYLEWSKHQRESYLSRMEYWVKFAEDGGYDKRENRPSAEWLLSQVVLTYILDNKTKNKNIIVKTLLALHGLKYSNTLHLLYDVLELMITEPSIYSGDYSSIVGEISNKINEFVLVLVDETCRTGDYGKLFGSARNFRYIYPKDKTSTEYETIAKLGATIVDNIETNSELQKKLTRKKKKKEYETIKYSFNPNHKDSIIAKRKIAIVIFVHLVLHAIATFIIGNFLQNMARTIVINAIGVIISTLCYYNFFFKRNFFLYY